MKHDWISTSFTLNLTRISYKKRFCGNTSIASFHVKLNYTQQHDLINIFFISVTKLPKQLALWPSIACWSSAGGNRVAPFFLLYVSYILFKHLTLRYYAQFHVTAPDYFFYYTHLVFVQLPLYLHLIRTG